MVWENNFFYILVLNGITGCVAYGLCKLAIKHTHDRFGCYDLYYRLLLGVEVCFAVPFAYLYVKLIRGANIYFYRGISGYDGNKVVAIIFHIIFVVWLIGAICKSIQYVKDYQKTKRLCVSNIPYFNEEIEEMFYNKYPHRRLRRVRIYQNYLAKSPCVVGVLRPKLILPEVEYSRQDWDIILAHEATHVIHRDNLWKWIGMIIVIACWWNPLIYALLNDWAEWTETHCDITVCKRFLDGDCRSYCRTLISSALFAENVMLHGASSFNVSQSVKRRITRLSRVHERKGRKGPVVLSILLSAIFIAGSGLTAFAAGNATSQVGATAYWSTVETTAESEMVLINLDCVDNVNVFRMSPEEFAASGYEVVAMEPEGVATYASVVDFDWNIRPQTFAASNNFLKLKDKTIEVSAYITASGSVRLGVIEPDGAFVYAMAAANKTTTVTYTTKQLGYYKAAVQNVTLTDANAHGFYTK